MDQYHLSVASSGASVTAASSLLVVSQSDVYGDDKPVAVDACHKTHILLQSNHEILSIWIASDGVGPSSTYRTYNATA